ncbi:MAG: hypothetical protein O3A95_09735 [Planctomycetota bacterium]|nr:hypothetical protein [Planctomycetota bacterium]MDA1114562.1 hypothetical protein [Planctomycetota bacterium]
MLQSCLSAALLVGFFAAPTAAQTFQTEIDLFGLGDPLASAKAFGISYEPVTDQIYVAISGDFGGNNNAVAVIDPLTNTVTSTITVGLFPEDIAFAYDDLGNFLYGAVTNSTSGTVSIWDASNSVVATIALPDPFLMGSSFPFGILEHQGYFWVTTQDGSGDVHAIDIASLSHDVAHSFSTNFRSGSRLAAQGDSLYIPTTEFLAGFSGSKGGVFQHDINAGAEVDHWFVERDDQFLAYPSGQEIAFLDDGSAFFTGLDFSGHLYKLDSNGQVDRVVDLEGANGQGLALNPAQDLLAIAGFVTNELVLVDVLNDTLLSRMDINSFGSGGHTFPNDVIFAHDRIYMTLQGSEKVLVFDNLPTVSANNSFSGTLTVSDTTPAQGSVVAIDLDGFAGFPVALLTGPNSSPINHLGVDFLIGGTLQRRAASGIGSLSLGMNIPLNPAIEGRQFFLQGYVTDGVSDFTTAPKVLVIQ